MNTVRPEYLLSYDEYKKFIKLEFKEISSKLAKEPNQKNYFEYVSCDSWVTLFYQIMRIYYLNRVTPKSFKNLPGMPASESTIEPWMQKSNVYSLAECILLKWMTYHFNQVNPTHQVSMFTNFDSDLRDGRVIAALIIQHYGEIKELGPMHPSPTTDAHRR